MATPVGDKVRLKGKTHNGERGAVHELRETEIVVRLLASNKLANASLSDVTNFSLAARKAWQQMPHRRVGRPKGSTTTDRISVTLRIDRTLWKRFQQAEITGQIVDRSGTVNEWFAEKLAELDAQQVHSTTRRQEGL